MTPVRTRFAPSPTGSLHLGNARIAVFNWLFTRHHGGVFILRIEDTDVDRNVEGALEPMLEDLRWLGLDWDEGPDIDGPNGPYRQSERGDSYSAAVKRLLDSGVAYPCFCEDAAQARDPEADGSGEGYRYPGTCRALSAEERETRMRESDGYLVRFAVPDGEIVIRDEVRGDVSFPAGDFADFVVVRRDGRPTYNFAVVVDDVAMSITDVIRGVGHLSNTPKQAILFDALGEERPRFTHLPMVLGQDRRKLSKREGDLSLAALREQGYPPSAVVNYLSLLGWSAADGEEVLDLATLIDQVDLDRVGASNTVFDLEKMRWLAGQHVTRMSLDDVVEAARPFVDRERIPLEGSALAEAIDVIRSRITIFEEINDHLSFFYPDAGADLDSARTEVRETPEASEVMREVQANLGALDRWDGATVGVAIREAGKSVGAKGRALFTPVRLAITGKESGPDIGRVMGVLGRDESMARIDATLAPGSV